MTALWNSAFSLFPDSDIFQGLIHLFQCLVKFLVVEKRKQQLDVIRVSLALVLARSAVDPQRLEVNR